ncbi:MAG: hypothetical protein IKO47_02155 [Ruminococcus sp.]|nr:hypothetical protein [Ruminococcus sp.]
MKKALCNILAPLLIFASAVSLTGCGSSSKCKHSEWKEADCTTPKTCVDCGETEGEPLGHKWTDATCDKPKTCSVCDATEGEPNGHTWTEATCDKPKTCKDCGATEGKAKGHTWVEATCDKAKTCSVCGKTDGQPQGHKYDKSKICTEDAVCERCGKTIKAAGHKWKDATCTAPKTCTVCGATEGGALGHAPENGYCKRCGEKIEINLLIYSDADIDVYYKGLSEGTLNAAEVNFYAVNKSNHSITVQVRNESVNGSMVSFTCSTTVAAGKNAYDDMSCSYRLYLNKIGVNSISDINTVEFCLHMYDRATKYSLETSPITIDTKNNTTSSAVSQDNGGGGQSSTVTLQQFVDAANDEFHSKGKTEINFYAKKNSSGVEYLYIESNSDGEYSSIETHIKVLADYNALLNTTGKDNSFATLAQKSKKLHYDRMKIHDDFCASWVTAVKKSGLNCPVELAITDTASGITGPLYISVNGTKSYDVLEKYMEEKGYVWYN